MPRTSRLRSWPISLLAAVALGAPLLAQTAPVAAAATSPSVAHGSTVTPVLAEAAAAVVATRVAGSRVSSRSASLAYAVTGKQADGSAIRWNPCSAVPWVFNPQQAPAGGLQAVSAALQRVSRATGLQFHYAGSSTDVPATRYLQAQSVTAPRPMLIGWTTGAQSTLLADQPANVAGMTQPLWARQASGATTIVSAVIALNARVSAPLSGGSSWRTLLLHEIGHATGLAHVTATNQVMHPVVPADLTDFAPGDLAGLRRVGAAGGCLA